MGLPRELRDNIYEEAVFDFPAQDTDELLHAFCQAWCTIPRPHVSMAGPAGPRGTCRVKSARINTNLLLRCNRQISKEAMNIFVLRAQLVQIKCAQDYKPLRWLLAYTGIPQLDRRYAQFCVMRHTSKLCRSPRETSREGSAADADTSPLNVVELKINMQDTVPRVWRSAGRGVDFIICRRDLAAFCRGLVGNYPYMTQWCVKNHIRRHILDFLNPFPLGSQHNNRLNDKDFANFIIKRQAEILSPYRKNLSAKRGQVFVGYNGIQLADICDDPRPFNERLDNGIRVAKAEMRKGEESLLPPDPLVLQQDLERLLGRMTACRLRPSGNVVKAVEAEVCFQKALTMLEGVGTSRKLGPQEVLPNFRKMVNRCGQECSESIFNILSDMLKMRGMYLVDWFVNHPEHFAWLAKRRYRREYLFGTCMISVELQNKAPCRELLAGQLLASGRQRHDLAMINYWLARALRVVHMPGNSNVREAPYGYLAITHAAELLPEDNIIRHELQMYQFWRLDIPLAYEENSRFNVRRISSLSQRRVRFREYVHMHYERTPTVLPDIIGGEGIFVRQDRH